MEDYGFWSIIPPIIAIILAIATRQVYVSLLFGIWVGWLVISDFHIWPSFLNTVEAIVHVFQSAGNTRTILFSCLVGVLILFIQISGGVRGFMIKLNERLEKIKPKNRTVFVQFLAWLTGLLLFVESNISVLTVGTLFRPTFDDQKISREKLAYIADSSSAPSCILIPFNAWGAFIMALLAERGYSEPFRLLISSIPYNFYPLLALTIVLIVIFSKRDIGPMKAAEERVKTTGELLWPGSQAMIADDITSVEVKEGVVPKQINMILPLVTMVLMMPVMLIYTGWDKAMEVIPNEGTGQQILYAIGQGSGSTSVLVSVIIAILVAIVLYSTQRMFSLKEIVNLTLKGMSEMLPLAIILILAFAISNVCAELETGNYVASIAERVLSPELIPLVVFIVSAFIAFSTGTSWGTFGIMIAIAIPMAQSMGANELLTVAAVLGGGVFGDHCSPISDTTIVSSMAAATDHIDHVRTQMPYALIGGALASLLYLIYGFVL